MTDNALLAHLRTVADGINTARIQLAGASMSPLLHKSAEDLYRFWESGLSALAFSGDRVIGHAALDPLAPDWFELGAVWVAPDMRGRKDNGHHPHVGLRLYGGILGAHSQKNILATTINPAAMVVGWRAGMVPVRYEDLPDDIWQITCCCPSEKTGVPTEQNVPGCTMRAKQCFVRVTRETWQRLGIPSRQDLPIGPPRTRPTIPKDDVTIVLAGTL